VSRRSTVRAVEELTTEGFPIVFGVGPSSGLLGDGSASDQADDLIRRLPPQRFQTTRASRDPRGLRAVSTSP
jgi:hypothetical protein